MKIKKIYVLVLLIILCTLFCGCATVRYSVTISDYGARVVDYTVIFNENQSTESHEFRSVRTFFEFLKSRNDHSEIIFDEANPRQIVYRITYEDQEDYYIANGITGDEPNEPIEGKVDGMFMEYEVPLLNFEKADFMIYALNYLPYYDINFDDRLKFYIVFDDWDDEVDSMLRQVKASKDPVRLLVSFLETSEHRAKLADETEKILAAQGYDFSELKIYFDYSHVYKSIYAKNADEVSTVETDLGKQTVYTWKLDPLSSNTITIYQKVPNVWIWELIAVIFGIVVAAACIVAFVMNRNKFNKKVASLTAAAGDENKNQNNDNTVQTDTSESTQGVENDGLFDVNSNDDNNK